MNIGLLAGCRIRTRHRRICTRSQSNNANISNLTGYRRTSRINDLMNLEREIIELNTQRIRSNILTLVGTRGVFSVSRCVFGTCVVLVVTVGVICRICVTCCGEPVLEMIVPGGRTCDVDVTGVMCTALLDDLSEMQS